MGYTSNPRIRGSLLHRNANKEWANLGGKKRYKKKKKKKRTDERKWISSTPLKNKKEQRKGLKKKGVNESRWGPVAIKQDYPDWVGVEDQPIVTKNS